MENIFTFINRAIHLLKSGFVAKTAHCFKVIENAQKCQIQVGMPVGVNHIVVLN